MTPTLSPAMQAIKQDIDKIFRNHPELLREGMTLFLGESGLSLSFPHHNITEQELHAVALAYPDAGWRPKAGSVPHELDWVGVIGGVKIRLPRAQSLPLERLPALVDLDAIRANLPLTLNAAGKEADHA